ncbi:concanavalin A-like lectin/glucanase superfamily protein [Flavobacterium sp. 103]|uniref:LamG domain-containing protein n=1 Tax=Flavobacterium sp. 103 TaxID=2135624 RepID=UPI000D5F84AD|nr:LamG domain-containing protein [Flavobacterium sp. 103]PVX44382.1 concanavalin A-like lectin/glucanase superfamily protein [Flavobacterium sp. 103]
MKKMTLLTVVFVFTFSINAQTAIQEFDFNGTLSNTKNEISFSGKAMFVNDRAGVPNSAIRLSNSYIEAMVLNLPPANSSRTVSIWVKYNDVTKANYIWGYGSLYNARYFGLLQQIATDSKSDLNLAGCGDENDVIVSTAVSSNIWYNYIVTYDGFTSKIYRNGELIKSSISPRKLTSGIVFSIGKKGPSVSINADIDDLKIYDVALSDEQIVTLYKGNSSLITKNVATTSITSVVGETKTVLAVPVTESKIRSSEIYSIKGVKVFASNTNVIDISSILDGTYLLEIANKTQSLADKKISSNLHKMEEAKTVLTVPLTEGGIKSFEIYSPKGAKVFAANASVIDISSIPEGTYSLKIRNTGQSPNDKIISSN